MCSLGFGSLPAQAQSVLTPNPLPQSEGTAEDLTGTLSRDSSLWLGGVGGEGDMEDSLTEDPYQISPAQVSPADSLPPHLRPLDPPSVYPVPFVQF